MNTLIHGLLMAAKDAFPDKDEDELPNLVTFNVGDMLRSYCFSK